MTLPWYLRSRLADFPGIEHAACAGLDPAMFFPGQGENTPKAKACCDRCPVRQACLTYALDAGIRDGIYGGLSARERRHLKVIR